MKILILNTKSVNNGIWKSYVEGFNSVFEKDFSLDFFKNKYESTSEGTSWHAFYVDEEKNIVAGACSALPANFSADGEKVKMAVLVDAFILKDYRKNPFVLSQMYASLKEAMIKENVSIVVAVPNVNSYSYWKNIAGFKDAGDLNFWILPLNIGSVLGRHKWLNAFSRIFSKGAILVSKIIACAIDAAQPKYKYEPLIDDEFLSKRLPPSAYKRVAFKEYEFFYKIENEGGIKTAYLFYAAKNKIFKHSALNFAVGEISKSEKPDIIIYVGKIGFARTSLFKVPKKFEPKKLPLIFDAIGGNGKYADASDINNWDFSLVNYDVR